MQPKLKTQPKSFTEKLEAVLQQPAPGNYTLSDGPATAMEYHVNEMSNLLELLRGLNHRLINVNYRASGPQNIELGQSGHSTGSDDMAGRLGAIQLDFRDELKVLDESLNTLENFI